MRQGNGAAAQYVTDGLIERFLIVNSQSRWGSSYRLNGECGSGIFLQAVSGNRFASDTAPVFSDIGYFLIGAVPKSSESATGNGVNLQTLGISGSFSVDILTGKTGNTNTNYLTLLSGTGYGGYITETKKFSSLAYNTNYYIDGHMVFIFDDDADEISVYRNGQLVTTESYDISTLLTTMLYIRGDRGWGVGDMMIYGKALSTAEVAQNYAYAQTLSYFEG